MKTTDREAVERALDTLYELYAAAGAPDPRVTRLYYRAISVVRERPPGARKVRSDALQIQKTPQEDWVDRAPLVERVPATQEGWIAQGDLTQDEKNRQISDLADRLMLVPPGSYSVPEDTTGSWNGFGPRHPP